MSDLANSNAISNYSGSGLFLSNRAPSPIFVWRVCSGAAKRRFHREASRYLVLVQENQLSRRESTETEKLQSSVAALSRVGESAETLRELASRRIEDKIDSAEEMDRDLGEIYELVMSQFSNILILLRSPTNRLEESAVKTVERLAKFRSRLETQWKQRIEKASDNSEDRILLHVQTLAYQQAFDALFHAASHLGHIAERMRLLSPERI